jgi:ornithine--oxo-acid transaminase
MNTQDFIDREALRTPQTYTPLSVVLTRGQGVWLWDVDGHKYMDMMGAYSANSFGHCNERLLGVLNKQAQTLCLTSRAFYSDRLAPLLEKLCSMSGFDMAITMNTGAEAVETAVKVVRRWAYEVKGIPSNKAEIIVAQNNFHGRTTTIISFSTEAEYQRDFGPLTPGFKAIPFGDAKALRDAITPNTCAFLVEPIQGETGIVTPPKGYLKEIRKICSENNVLLILDEIQSGLGRTGKLFAFQHEDIVPDGVTIAKALGGGILPISAFLSRRDILSLMGPGSHGSTFGGNPLASTVALEALTMLEEGLIDKAAHLGAYMSDRMHKIRSPLIKEIRGQGLWFGVEFNPEFVSGREVCEKMLTKGVLTKDTHKTVVRFAPPLTVTQEELDFGLASFEAAIRELEEERLGSDVRNQKSDIN